MGGRAKPLPEVTAIQFLEDFDHVEVGKTVAYKAGNIVREPSDELVAAAGAKAALYSDEERVSDPAGDGE